MPRETSATGEKSLVQALADRDRDALLAAYHMDRDRLEAALQHSLDQLPTRY